MQGFKTGVQNIFAIHAMSQEQIDYPDKTIEHPETGNLTRDSQWCLVQGSPWERMQHKPNELENNDQLIVSAFRQMKYELYCASVDLLGYSLTILPSRNCIARPVFFLDEPDKQFEFIYDHERHHYTDVVWSEFALSYESTLRYWILEQNCIAGFLSEVLIDMLNTYGSAPLRR